MNPHLPMVKIPNNESFLAWSIQIHHKYNIEIRDFMFISGIVKINKRGNEIRIAALAC